jgi:hypothetical protein
VLIASKRSCNSVLNPHDNYSNVTRKYLGAIFQKTVQPDRHDLFRRKSNPEIHPVIVTRAKRSSRMAAKHFGRELA